MTARIIPAENSVTGDGNATFQFDISGGKTFRIEKLRWEKGGAFDFTRIRDTDSGQEYLSSAVDSPVLETVDGELCWIPDEPIILEGPTTLTIDVTDTSSSTNLITMALHGVEQ